MDFKTFINLIKNMKVIVEFRYVIFVYELNFPLHLNSDNILNLTSI